MYAIIRIYQKSTPPKAVTQMETGVIFDIKEFSIFDGPGVRQTVFLKGCPLRCSWCHNPEGLSAVPQVMVSQNACTGCGKCRQRCRTAFCTACGECVKICPQNARRIAGTRMTAEELAKILLKDAAYYAQLGGGVTFSGGEPLMQSGFLIDVLDRLAGVHRAIETSGFAGEDIFFAVLERLDYVLMDIKLMDDAKHRRYTGVSNERILANARTLIKSGKPCTLRVPLIPGVNDDTENIEATARFIADAGGADVELLPYHKTAGAKYAMLGMEYRPDFDPERQLEMHLDTFARYGLEVKVL